MKDGKLLIQKGDKVRYENRYCLVESISDNEVVLVNLEKRDSSDWTALKISIQDYYSMEVLNEK